MSWLYLKPEMLRLMEKISSTGFPIRSLLLSAEPALSYLHTSAYNHGFPHLHRFFKQAIAPYITTLRLEFVLRVPVELVTMCTHLQDLRVVYTSFTFTEPEILGFLDLDTGGPLNRPVDRDRRPRILALEYKVLEDGYDINPDTSLSKLLADGSMLDFSHLRCLTTFTDEPVRNLDLAQRIVDASKEKLEDVIIEMYNHEIKLNRDPSTFLNFANQLSLQSLSYIAFFNAPKPDSTAGEGGGISDACKMLKTITQLSSSSSRNLSGCLRNFNLTLILDHQAQDLLLQDADWDTFVSEVTRIRSLLTRSVSGQQKLALTLDMHYYIPAGVPFSEWGTEPERYAEGILYRLVDERLASLKDCAWVTLEQHVVIIELEC